MNLRKKQQESTRGAILEALGEVIAESGSSGFSIQEVADRAGVTHRTVYNHFPTREALNDAFAVHVEHRLAEAGHKVVFDGFSKKIDALFETFSEFEQLDAQVRAYVMLMIASRTPAGVHQDRTKKFKKLIAKEYGPFPGRNADKVTAAVRMFGSSMGWHLMTEHLGLSTAEASETGAWAARTLLAAAKRGNLPGGKK